MKRRMFWTRRSQSENNVLFAAVLTLSSRTVHVGVPWVWLLGPSEEDAK